MLGVEGGGTRVQPVDGVLAAVDDNCRDRRSRILAAEALVRIVDDLGIGQDADPATQDEAVVTLPDPRGIRRAVGDLGDPDPAVAVEGSFKWLPLVAATVRVRVVPVAAAKDAHVT
jgi:hypothetical protein